MRQIFILFFVILLSSDFIFAQKESEKDSSNIFYLGEILVKGDKNIQQEVFIPIQKLETFTRLTVTQSLNLLAGITIANVGPRNESMVHIRGFDLRQVPVFIDGIPVYVPYDGYVDLARFTTFDLSEINVAKGFSSVLYGANNLGGAINLVSRRPSKQLEINGMSGWLSNGYRANINIGSNLGKFYIQGGVSRLNRDAYPLSKQFEISSREDGGNRERAYNDDVKFNLKLAYTPQKGQEFAINYINQQGSKGNPVYTGTDVQNPQFNNPRFWDWPQWDKQSLYFISNSELNEKNYLKSRLYYDVFKNQLDSYDDNTYTAQTRPFAFSSFYDDYTYGASLELGSRMIAQNQLKFAIHYKKDVHRENNRNEPVRTMSDNTLSVAIEDSWNIIEQFAIIIGTSFNLRQSVKADNFNSQTQEILPFPTNRNEAWNAQIGFFYNFTEQRQINFSIARKTRFATVKDRYSYRLGTALPNPDLKAENALNYELNYNDLIGNKLNIQAGLFYSKIQNVIQNVNNVYFDPILKRQLSQFQNTGSAEFMGGEMNIAYPLIKKLNWGLNYTFIERKNISNPDIQFVDVPKHKFFTYTQFNFTDKIYLLASFEFNSARFSTSYGTETQDFGLVNLKASGTIWKYFGLEAGMNNVLDRNYFLAEGYPEAGRNFFINFSYNY